MKNGEPPTAARQSFPFAATTAAVKVSSPLSALYDSCLNLIYPHSCRACRSGGGGGKIVEARADGAACRACWEKTRIFDGTEILCEKCGAFLQSNGEEFKTSCRRCDDDFFDAARAAGLYEHALLAAVINLKTVPLVPQRLRNIFLDAFLKAPFSDATRIVPVPLSRRRQKERGFNQAALLAKVLSKRTGLPLDEQSLVRTLDTPLHRAGMDKKLRLESVRDAFAVTRPKLVRDEIVLLIDDVFTSGATASNCAAKLKEKGARAVYVLTAARAF